MTADAVADLIPSPDVLVAHLSGEAVLLHMGTKRYFRLNGTGAEVWKGLEAGESVDAVARRLMEKFDVGEGDVRAETGRFCDALRSAGLLDSAAGA